MMNWWQFVILLVTSIAVTTSSHVMSRQVFARRDLASGTLTNPEIPATTKSFSTTTHITTTNSSSNRNNACGGCDGGNNCRYTIPPCYRGPYPFCLSSNPDPSYHCERYICNPRWMCVSW